MEKSSALGRRRCFEDALWHRFCKDGCKIKGNEAAWPGFIATQLEWALLMKKVIGELGL